MIIKVKILTTKLSPNYPNPNNLYFSETKDLHNPKYLKK
uniref:Uncharacterized protein n=1 Tax=Podoviridae sp. ctQyH19 TaxID=2825249 RepID=A0A8S5UR05_9CAUD|nr:MAG TPA: hypothetical protein [Podoviridae sp. ctQyH19]